VKVCGDQDIDNEDYDVNGEENKVKIGKFIHKIKY
jgi:hypothetical protein